MDVPSVGAMAFGSVIGWVTYRTLRRKEGTAALSDLSSVIAAVGGGVVTALFKSGELFGWYSIGLAIGFFTYFIISLAVSGKESAKTWMGE
jgi:EamA domain-containing membrane protein RarD